MFGAGESREAVRPLRHLCTVFQWVCRAWSAQSSTAPTSVIFNVQVGKQFDKITIFQSWLDCQNMLPMGTTRVMFTRTERQLLGSFDGRSTVEKCCHSDARFFVELVVARSVIVKDLVI